jgi:hypothetical protein
MACLSKYGTDGPKKTMANEWRNKEAERVKA